MPGLNPRLNQWPAADVFDPEQVPGGREVKVAPREGVTPRCAICHDDAADGPLLCPACQTVVHAECRVGLPCPTLGCPHGPRGPVRERVVVLRPSLGEVLTEAVVGVAQTARRRLPRELVVAALVVLGLAGAAVGVNVALASSHAGRERVMQLQGDLLMIEGAADLFRRARGRWPASVDELVAQGLLAERPLDPWGEAYALQVSDAGCEALSGGADGALGTGDDISSVAWR